jgi:hypothetical protein
LYAIAAFKHEALVDVVVLVQVPEVIKVVEDALDESKSIVISVQKTGDARTAKRYLANEAAGKSSGGGGGSSGGAPAVKRAPRLPKEPSCLDDDSSEEGGDDDDEDGAEEGGDDDDHGDASVGVARGGSVGRRR